MIIKKPNKLSILVLLISFFFCLPLFSDILTDQTLKSDLNYYRKVSSQKNLDSNDRTYILKRIEEKYDGSGIDTSPLDRELENVSNGTFEQEAPAPKQAKPAKSSTKRKIKAPAKTAPAGRAGKVEKIFVSETRTESKIFIAATGVTRSNYFLMKDPSSGNPPKVVLDLYGVQNKLSAPARDITTKNGMFSNVTAVQFEGVPRNVVRVIAELRKEVPYTVKKEGDLWLISASKAPEEQSPVTEAAAPVMIPAPAEKAESTEPDEGSYVSSVTVTGFNPPVPARAVPIEETAAADLSSKNIKEDYRVENGDILGITIYPADELSREVIVQPDGNISFPLIGSAQAKGKTIKQLENGLASELGRFIAAPQVTITVKQFSRRQIFITGEVKGVGAYNYKDNLRLLEFISSIGGFTESADRRQVKIYRGPPTKRQIHTENVEELVKSGDFSKDFLLEPGDIIEVQKGQAKIAILGDIKSPGYYDYKDNMRLVELISTAGGFTDTAKINEISVIHPGPEGRQMVVKVNLKNILSGKEKDIVLASGDTVYLPKGKMASANWFLTNILPWISLISLMVVIRAGL